MIGNREQQSCSLLQHHQQFAISIFICIPYIGGMNTKEKPKGKKLRKGRHSRPGGIYLITFVTSNRETLFTDLTTARLVISSLRKSKGAETLCFVVMPDHVHWLLQLRPHGELSATIRGVKSASARCINRHLKRIDPSVSNQTVKNQTAENGSASSAAEASAHAVVDH